MRLNGNNTHARTVETTNNPHGMYGRSHAPIRVRHLLDRRRVATVIFIPFRPSFSLQNTYATLPSFGLAGASKKQNGTRRGWSQHCSTSELRGLGSAAIKQITTVQCNALKFASAQGQKKYRRRRATDKLSAKHTESMSRARFMNMTGGLSGTVEVLIKAPPTPDFDQNL